MFSQAICVQEVLVAQPQFKPQFENVAKTARLLSETARMAQCTAIITTFIAATFTLAR